MASTQTSLSKDDPAASSTPNVWFKSPVSGSTLSGTRSLSTCYVNARGVDRVQFLLDSTPLNHDTNVADGMSCLLDTTKFANGAHQLVAMGFGMVLHLQLFYKETGLHSV